MIDFVEDLIREIQERKESCKEHLNFCPLEQVIVYREKTKVFDEIIGLIKDKLKEEGKESYGFIERSL